MDERRDEIEDESDSAAAAFEELRAEVSALRGAIDAISAAVHESGPPDYAPTLGAIVKAVQELEKRLAVHRGSLARRGRSSHICSQLFLAFNSDPNGPWLRMS